MKIHFVNGPRAGGEVEFALPEITIGREDGNILRIPTVDVSRYHARLWLADGQWFISDQSSTNGIKLNGTRISGAQPVADGDIIELGKQILRLSELSGEAPKIIFNPILTPTPVETGAPLLPGAAPGTAVVPPPEPQPEPSEKKMIDLEKSEIPLFSERGSREEPETRENRGSRRFSNRTYYIILGCLAVMGISLCVILNQEQKTVDAAVVPVADQSLSLYFERKIVERDNVFLFTLLIEGKRAVFTIDDVKSRRHFQRVVEDVDGLDYLRSRLDAAGIWEVKTPPPPPGREALNRKLMIASPPRLISVAVAGDHAPAAFDKAEAAIRDFTENYGLQTISLTREELERQAEEAFRKAEELFANREASPANLRDSIIRYRKTMSNLEQFSPRPAMYEKARQRLEEAQQLRQRKLDNLNYEYRRYLDLRDFASLRQTLLQIMEYSDPGSSEYETARERIFKLDTYNNRKGK